MSDFVSDFMDMLSSMDKITKKHRDVHLAIYEEYLDSTTIKITYDYSRTFISFIGTEYVMIISNIKDKYYCEIKITYQDKPIHIKKWNNIQYSINSFEELKKEINYIDNNKKYLTKKI